MSAQTNPTNLANTTATVAVYSAQPPQFPQTGIRRSVSVTTVMSSIAAGSAAGDTVLLSASDNVNGGLLKRLYAIPLATNSATALYLLRTGKQINTGTAVKQVEDAVTAGAQTISTSASPTPVTFTQYNYTTPMRLSPGDALSVGIGVALTAGWIFIAEIELFSAVP